MFRENVLHGRLAALLKSDFAQTRQTEPFRFEFALSASREPGELLVDGLTVSRCHFPRSLLALAGLAMIR